MNDYGAAALAQRKLDNPLTPPYNACGHWSITGLAIRHYACRNLPLDKCARPVYAGVNPDLPKDVIE